MSSRRPNPFAAHGEASSLLNPSLLDSVSEKPRCVLFCAHVVSISNSLDLTTTLCLSVCLDNSCSVTAEPPKQLSHHVCLCHSVLEDA